MYAYFIPDLARLERLIQYLRDITKDVGSCQDGLAVQNAGIQIYENKETQFPNDRDIFWLNINVVFIAGTFC